MWLSQLLQGERKGERMMDSLFLQMPTFWWLFKISKSMRRKRGSVGFWAPPPPQLWKWSNSDTVNFSPMKDREVDSGIIWRPTYAAEPLDHRRPDTITIGFHSLSLRNGMKNKRLANNWDQWFWDRDFVGI